MQHIFEKIFNLFRVCSSSPEAGRGNCLTVALCILLQTLSCKPEGQIYILNSQFTIQCY